MAKIVQLNGQRPGGWAKDRWEWLKRVRRDDRLAPMTRLIAHSLGFGFANWDNGECRPGHASISEDCGTSIRTVERAMADLERAGWVVRIGREAPGVSALIRFSFPERPPEVAAERPPEVAAERPPEVAAEDDQRPPDLSSTPAKSGGTYKEEPNLNHKTRLPLHATRVTVPGGARPTPLQALVGINTEARTEWDAWLTAHGFPGLDKIGQHIKHAGAVYFDLPWRYPPRADDETSTRVAGRFAEWLRSRA